MFIKFFPGNMDWNQRSFFQSLRHLVEQFLELFPSFWNYAVFQVEKNPITVGNIILGLSLIILGYISIRLVIKYFEKRVLARLDIDVSQRYTIKVFLSYFLLILLFLFTLHLIQVPLTVFTVIGGAVALGLGFGARNIMNNFISGIVIVLEHPVRVGDLICINDLICIVEHVGFRATSVRTLDNTHVIIPNSSIMEQNILNWTLSDRVVRREISVGVVYGSPATRVRELLLKVAEGHEKVLTYNKNQKPLVIFSDFGDNALQFKLFVWIAVERPLDLNQVASDIRYRIDELFRQEGIVIAFPQRDLHIKEPVSIRMISENK